MPNQYIPHSRSCPHCTKPFFCKPSSKQRYCSQSCARHYGSRGPRPHLRRPMADRFWPKVNKISGVWWNGTECWVWVASFGSTGYGQIHDGTRLIGAHVASYRIAFGAIPDGLWVLHRCDNPACVRPDHLFLGTRIDNVHDMHAKGRGATGDRHPARVRPDYLPRGDNHPARTRGDYLPRSDQHHSRLHPELVARGERHARAKLTEDMVRAIRAEHAATGIRFKALGEKYGISDSNARVIVRRKSWKHVA